jgi:hypothetical protein
MALDNSGHGLQHVPSFDGVPVDYGLDVHDRFAHGFNEWRQCPVLTAQELAMVAVMDRLTDKPTWSVDVFDDAIVEASAPFASLTRQSSDATLANPVRVDPYYRVCSTRNLPPQQHEWWASAVGRELATLGLPQEIIDQIMKHTENWPMGMDVAGWHRDQLVQDHLQVDLV